MTDRRLMRRAIRHDSSSLPRYDHLDPAATSSSSSNSMLTVIWIEALPGPWTDSTSLRESTATAYDTSPCSSVVSGNATGDPCREGMMSSDTWELRGSDLGSAESSGPFHPTWALVLIGLLAGCTSLVTVSGNLIVILSFFLDRTIRQPSNYFIASLAVSDLVIGAVSMPFYTIYLLTGQHWPLGEILCDLWLSVDYTVCLCSIYTVFCITIDRFCSVKIPAKYRNWRTERKVLIVVALTWVVPALVFFPSVFGWQSFVGQRTVPEGKCYVQYMEDALFNCFLQVGYFWVTLCAMCGLYGGIYRVALNLQHKSDLKQKTTKLVSSAGKKMARIGSGVVGDDDDDDDDDDHPGRKEDTRGNDANGKGGRRMVNNGGCDRSSRGGGGVGGVGGVGGGGSEVTNGRRQEEDEEEEEEEREDSLSSPDYPGIVYVDEKKSDGLQRQRHLSTGFIHHVDGAMTPEEDNREREREAADRTMKRKRNDGTKDSVDCRPVQNAAAAQRQSGNHARDRNPRSSGADNIRGRTEDGHRSSPNLFTGSGSLVRGKTRKAVFIGRTSSGCDGYEDVEYPARFEVRWLSEDDLLESRLFEENVRLLVRSHRIDSSTTDSPCGEEPGSPVWKKRDSPSEHSALLVAVDEGGRSTQYQSTLQKGEVTMGTGRKDRTKNRTKDRRKDRTKDNNSRSGNQKSSLTGRVGGGFGSNGGFHAVKGYQRVLARIREWRDGSGHRHSSIDEAQTPSPPLPLPLPVHPPPCPPPPPQNVCSRLRHVFNNGEIELKHLGGRESTADIGATTATGGGPQRVPGHGPTDHGPSVHPCSNQSSLRGGAQGGNAVPAPLQSVLRRLRKFDDSQNRESSSGAEAGRKCKRVNRARKALRTITVILGAFVLCWTPWHVLSMIIGFCPKGIVCVTPVLYDISYWLCYLNSPLNPFCYALANQQFKKTFTRILKFDWHRN